jgi:hypothetical protein
MVSTVTIGAVSYSVYALTVSPITDADDYLNAKIGGSAWAAASADDKARSLVSAARWMDRVATFSGTKTVATQPLEWPRDSATCDGTAITDGTVPDDIALAEFELALALLADSTIQDGTGEGSNVKRAKAGSAEVEFFSSTLGGVNDTRLPQTANDLLKCYFGADPSGFGFSSGTSDSSAFCDTDFDKSDGYS